MREIIIYSIILVILFLFLADTKITFSPFTFKVFHLWKAIGWVTVAIGVIMITKDAENTAYKKGSTETLQELDKQLSKIIKK
jgi:hypothetical protein